MEETPVADAEVDKAALAPAEEAAADDARGVSADSAGGPSGSQIDEAYRCGHRLPHAHPEKVCAMPETHAGVPNLPADACSSLLKCSRFVRALHGSWPV